MVWKHDYHKKIKELIIVAHFFAIMICILALISYLNFESLTNIIYTFSYTILTLVIISFITIIYMEKVFINKRAGETKVYSYSFSILLLALIVITLNYTGQDKSLYEMLFILPVITISIIHGVKPGLLLAALESVYIIYYHQGFIPNNFLDISFIYSGILFLTAWLIGSFAELEMKMRKNLEAMVNIDGLTGLCNHRHFQEILKNEIEQTSDEKTISLILIDIDFFKYYNDMFGHQRGDEILKRIGELISAHLPPECVAARYGGDEFAVILPGYSSEAAVKIAETFRREVEKTQFYKESHLPNSKVTLSLGVATYPENVKTQSELLNAADEALYKVKYMDKNKVKIYFSVLDDIKTEFDESENEISSSLRTLLSIINARDRYTYGHSERVMEYAVKMADALKLDKQEKNNLKYGAFLHDIGKIEIDRELLNKTGPLTELEMKTMQQHPLYGAAMLKPIASLTDCVDIILFHHENLDGSGYPEGLQGEEIPLGARILRVIDSYDAMITDRPYRSAISPQEALNELKNFAGIYYDPEVVAVFVQEITEELDTSREEVASSGQQAQ